MIPNVLSLAVREKSCDEGSSGPRDVCQQQEAAQFSILFQSNFVFLISIEYNLCTKLRSHSSDRRVQVLR